MTAVDPHVAPYRLLPPDLPVNEFEEEVIARWSEEGILERADVAREGSPEFVFFEGPPTANGRPGIHHVFARTIKDLFCRYRVMTGCHVTRKAGWDTHGLPVEIEVEKQLAARVAEERGLEPGQLALMSGKQLIEEFGVEEFNKLCRESVWKYKGEWERLSSRIGYWLDYRDPYITYENDYIESEWWALKTLYERDLLYRGHKILPYCPRCGTALSSHEVAQGYEDVLDPSVYVVLALRDAGGGMRDAEQPRGRGTSPHEPVASRLPHPASRKILVWTTTPWTLVSNVALAVNPDLTYLEVRRRERPEEGTLILAESRAAAVLGEDFTDRWEIVGRMRGSELVGMRYERPLDWVAYGSGEHEVVIGESFVSAEDGSGVVHMSPAFGADDYAAAQRNGLAFVQPVNLRGEFPAEMPVVGGLFVKKADERIIEELRKRGVLFKAQKIEHAYPHCWRCGTPLLYYARESWFVRTTAFRDAMLARNARVDWHPPEVGQGRFGEWLENNIDWALSRDRYWGTPLPVWVCEADRSHVEVIGSYAELAERSGAPLPSDFDPHKPYIDRYEWACLECGSPMHRTPEVIDTWFDSGSMPFAQWHYPFENREVTERHYPADFIAEGVDQTRGWFYSLLAIATGLGDALPHNGGATGAATVDGIAAPYRAVVVNDLVLDANGVKMSKSRGNAVDPWAVLARHGADAVRLFLIASSQVWLPRRFDEEAIRETAGRFLLTLRNTYQFFAQYAAFGWSPNLENPSPEERPAIDRWVLSRLTRVEQDVNAMLARYESTAAARLIMDFVVDDVSNWYVRLTRGRFYDVESADSRAAFATLHEVLVVTCRLLAPFAPFLTDWMHRELTGVSAHLASFTRGERAAATLDESLELAMAQLRTLATLGRAAREAANIKVRQPLSRLVCVVPNFQAALLEPLVPLLAAELNVKRVEFATAGDALVELEARPNFRSLGKRFGKRTPLAAQAVAALRGEALAALERGEPVAISVEGEPHDVVPEDVQLLRRGVGDLVVQEAGGFVAAIDPAITPALRAEGLARELVSRVQRMRKDAGFAISDRIRLHVTGNEEVERAVQEFQAYVASEVLAVDVTIGGHVEGSPDAVQTVELDDLSVRIALTRV
ncbi:MAG TPA: isoleucine--tRNA ligase [Gemmatimonadaceae bacterium]